MKPANEILDEARALEIDAEELNIACDCSSAFVLRLAKSYRELAELFRCHVAEHDVFQEMIRLIDRVHDLEIENAGLTANLRKVQALVEWM